MKKNEQFKNTETGRKMFSIRFVNKINRTVSLKTFYIMHLKTQKHNCMTIKNIFGSVMQFTPQKCLKQNEDKSVRKTSTQLFHLYTKTQYFS